MQFSIGNDHAGVEYKNNIVSYLKSKGHEVFNHGSDIEESVDYPDFIHPVAQDDQPIMPDSPRPAWHRSGW